MIKKRSVYKGLATGTEGIRREKRRRRFSEASQWDKN